MKARVRANKIDGNGLSDGDRHKASKMDKICLWTYHFVPSQFVACQNFGFGVFGTGMPGKTQTTPPSQSLRKSLQNFDQNNSENIPNFPHPKMTVLP